MRRRHLNHPIGGLSGTNFEVSVESKFMTLPAIFLNGRICLVCTQEGLSDSFGWKMKAFGLWLPYSGSTKVECFRFADGFSGFWPKRVSEHSQTQFYQAYCVEKCSASLLSHARWKKDLPKLTTTSSYKLESFSPIF